MHGAASSWTSLLCNLVLQTSHFVPHVQCMPLQFLPSLRCLTEAAMPQAWMGQMKIFVQSRQPQLDGKNEQKNVRKSSIYNHSQTLPNGDGRNGGNGDTYHWSRSNAIVYQGLRDIWERIPSGSMGQGGGGKTPDEIRKPPRDANFEKCGF